MGTLDTDALMGGRYVPRRRIAAGGMGTVWEATDTVLGRAVALKVLAEPLASDPSFVERFRREARAAARLAHPNIVGVYDYGEDGDLFYIVMEFINGETLAERLRREGRLEPPEAARIAAEVADALEAAHRAGIVHRDVKPSNVMLAQGGEVRVTDFGIATSGMGDALTTSGSILATAAYLAPERARGEPATPASDLYSLGIVLYEMLAGHPPFAAESPLGAVMAHAQETAAPLRELVPGVPPGLARACELAMAKDPAARPSSAAAFAAMLRGSPSAELATTLPGVPAASIPAAERTAVLQLPPTAELRPSSRRPLRFGRPVAFLAGLVVLGALGWVLASGLDAGQGGAPAIPTPSTPTSASPTSVPVPDVRGLTVAAAEARLRASGFTSLITKPAPGPRGTVVRTDPGAGAHVPAATQVTLYVGTPGSHGHHGNGPGQGQGG